MTPEQKIKHAILQIIASWDEEPAPDVTAENVDELYDAADESYVQGARNEIRSGEYKTNLPCNLSNNYESEAVAARMPDGSWVGWTYWYGGGKHGSPEDMDWMDGAYGLDCAEEEKVVIVRTFKKVGE